MKFAAAKGRRFRLTPAVVRAQLDTAKLIDLFDNRKAVLQSEKSEPGLNGPMTLTKATREHGVLRGELLKRGLSVELLDYMEGEV